MDKINNKFIQTFNLKLFAILFFLYWLNIYVFDYLPEYFAKHNNNNPVTDIILSNINPIDFSWLLVFGYFVPQILFFIYLLLKKNFKTFFYFYFVMGALSLTRLFFNMMTNLQVQSDAVPSKYFTSLFMDNDLFFSGHTALPFLFFLIYKKLDKKYTYITMIIWTILMAITVIFMKVHYTIDVMSAPFITFGIFYCSDLFLQKRFNIDIKKEYYK